MACSQFARKTAWCWFVILATPVLVIGQSGFAPLGSEYSPTGVKLGDQVFPAVSVKPSGGFMVWEDNRTDGDGLGVSALKLDSNFSAPLGSFRVNEQGAGDQSHAAVSLLKNGGAAFVWLGGAKGKQHVVGRFLSSSNTWLGGDITISTYTNGPQLTPAVATLSNGNVIVVWASLNQQSGNSMQDVYARLLSPVGQPIGNPFLVNLTTTFNQRSPMVAALSDGKYVVSWISEQQRTRFPYVNATNGSSQGQISWASVDLYARLFQANGSATTDEFILNGGSNVCSSPNISASSDGGFLATWIEKNTAVTTDSWDVFARPFSGSGFGGITRRVNTRTYGDQVSPKVSSVGTDYMVVWTSMGQDGSREGIYGQFLHGDGSLAGGEFRVNSTTVSQQMHPALASDGSGRFLAVWTSFVGGAGSFDIFTQRYVSTNQPLYAPDAPFVTVISSNTLSVTWPSLTDNGYSIDHYEVYADGSGTPTAVPTDNMWLATGLAPSSTHSYRLAYVLTDGRHSPISAATANTTYSAGATWGGIPQEWMSRFYGADIFSWPSPFVDSDGDGVSNRDEFYQGTDPTNPNSVLRQQLTQSAQGPYLVWNTTPGLIYQVMTSTTPGSWSNLGAPRMAAGTADSVFVGGGQGTRFYRIRRVQ
jgi:hypothetical protein